MVADFTVAAESPGGGDVFFGFVQVAFAEINPAERVPISDERWDQRELLRGETIERQIAERGGGSRDGGLGVLLGAVEMRLFSARVGTRCCSRRAAWRRVRRRGRRCEGFIVLTEVNRHRRG